MKPSPQRPRMKRRKTSNSFKKAWPKSSLRSCLIVISSALKLSQHLQRWHLKSCEKYLSTRAEPEQPSTVQCKKMSLTDDEFMDLTPANGLLH